MDIKSEIPPWQGAYPIVCWEIRICKNLETERIVALILSSVGERPMFWGDGNTFVEAWASLTEMVIAEKIFIDSFVKHK